MIKYLLPLTCVLLSSPPSGAQGSWIQKNNFGGVARSEAVSFTIGNRAFMGLGYVSASSSFRNDIWEYTPGTDSWTQKAVFSGGGRANAVAFVINGLGYVGTGRDAGGSKNDFWEYNPGSNGWTARTNFGGAARSGAVGFAVDSLGYLGLGSTQTQDFWKYSPASDSWVAVTNFPGLPRNDAVAFSIGSLGYVGTGYRVSLSTFLKDFYEYNPVSNSWNPRAVFGGNARDHGVGFSLCGYGFIGGGDNTNMGFFFSDFWRYDQSANSWSPVASMPAMTERIDAAAFIVNGVAYMGTGYDGYNFFTDMGDIWCYTPAGGACILPLEWLSFNGKPQPDGGALLKWETAGENNTDYFAVERKGGDGEGFEETGIIKASGYSTSPAHYSFIDLHGARNTAPNTVFYYRLRQVDFNGSYSFSQIISVTTEGFVTGAVHGMMHNGILSVSLHGMAAAGESVMLTVYEATGRRILSFSMNLTDHTDPLELKMPALQTGAYFLSASCGTWKGTGKFLVE